MKQPTFSMTGFGRGEATGDNYSLVIEIKTVNNRFRDFRFKMPSAFNEDELVVRRKLESRFKRGSFDINVSYKRSAEATREDDLDLNKIKSFVASMSGVSKDTGAPITIRPVDFLRSEFLVDDSEKKKCELKDLLGGALDSAIENLAQSRLDEGEKLEGIILGHVSEYRKQFDLVEKQAETYEKNVKERILQKFEEYKTQVDEPRFLQEVIYYLEKLDIHEEINRIKVHLEKLESTLDQTAEKGRKLDFLLQELNRETNTIGSKSGCTEISSAVVQMKVHLEKVREQALNIE